jgi:transposase
MEAFTTRERRKIISLYQDGLDTEDIARQFAASESGVRRVWQQYREEGRDEAAFANCGRKPTLTAEQMRQVRQIVREKPDRFVREVAGEVRDRLGIVACRQTVGRWLRRLGLTRKKSRPTPSQQRRRPDVKRQRDDWMDALALACEGDFARVLFIDETGAMTNLMRTHGRSPQGSRCVAHAPAGHWKVMTAAATMACPMDGELFETYLREALLPALSAGDVVVMDNLASHRHPRVRELIESAGAKLLYLPPYSPDFNPIEMIWSKVKRLLRSAAARTIEALHGAFGDAMTAVTPGDILGCFRHCGYATTSGAPL